MRFATRTFLWSFVPFAVLLMGSFWAIQKLVESTVRERLRTSLRETHESFARVRAKSELQNSRFLRVVGENAALKAGIQLLLSEPNSRAAQLTVEDQLREICESLGFDLLVVSSPNRVALAGLVRAGPNLIGVDTAAMDLTERGFVTINGRSYQVTSVPIDQGDENIAVLSLGEHFDFTEFNTPAVLTRNGKVLRSSIPGIPLAEVETALAGCREQAECEVVLRGETYLSLPMHSVYFGDGHLLRSLQSVDSAAGPVQSILRSVFLVTGIGALFAALVLGVLSSRSIVKPIASVIFRLRESEKTGLLPEFDLKRAPVLEIRELSESFNRAAGAIREARENLHSAYVEFIGSLASALDARDPYTAGHSHRVSQFACAIARALNFSDDKLEEIRIGALLHDIGKIGIADSVLQKRGRLTEEEWELIKQHPAIGRRILEGVHGFHDYLPTVELHHENWDGTGYPHGQRGEETPIAARIVHVADAYDAMTSDRPYRPGMSRARALELLRESAGTQFDPAIVPIFVRLMETAGDPGLLADSPEPASIHSLAGAVAAAAVEQPVAEDA